MSEEARPVKNLEIQGGDAPDALVGLEEVQKVLLGVLDNLSLWCQLYGLQEDKIRCTGPSWQSWNLIFFRLKTADGRPLSLNRYDPRLPHREGVFKNRPIRIKDFVAVSPWFRRLAHDLDHHIHGFMRDRFMKKTDLNVTSRWATNGCVLIKLIDKRDPMSPKTFMTHYRDG